MDENKMNELRKAADRYFAEIKIARSSTETIPEDQIFIPGLQVVL